MQLVAVLGPFGSNNYIAVCIGVLLGDRGEEGKGIHATVTLFPSPVPNTCFEEAWRVQTDFNTLMHRVAHDYDFMKAALQK